MGFAIGGGVVDDWYTAFWLFPLLALGAIVGVLLYQEHKLLRRKAS